jgi:hypothetical protein
MPKTKEGIKVCIFDGRPDEWIETYIADLQKQLKSIAKDFNKQIIEAKRELASRKAFIRLLTDPIEVKNTNRRSNGDLKPLKRKANKDN